MIVIFLYERKFIKKIIFRNYYYNNNNNYFFLNYSENKNEK